MVVYFRIAVALLICCVVPSSVIAQEKPKIFLGASSKTLGYSPLWVGARKGFFEQQGFRCAVGAVARDADDRSSSFRRVFAYRLWRR